MALLETGCGLGGAWNWMRIVVFDVLNLRIGLPEFD